MFGLVQGAEVESLKGARTNAPGAGGLSDGLEGAYAVREGWDYVFPSFRLKRQETAVGFHHGAEVSCGPLLLRLALSGKDEQVRFGFHNFRHSLASALVKLKCDPKTVQGIATSRGRWDNHAALRTVGPGVEARSTGQVPGVAAGRQGPSAHRSEYSDILGLNRGLEKFGEIVEVLWIVVARDGVEPPTPAFSGLRSTT